jgi:tRNA A-37 threonylcarbamoyl transferase component Bud32
MAKPDSLIGTRFDEYELRALLGKGGMARVYRGVDIRLQRTVAIKVIDTPYRQNTDYGTRFQREAQAIARLEHPNVVRLYRYGEKDGVLYMAMQYVEGTDLQNVLDSYRSSQEFMSAEDLLHVIRQVCAALDYIHQKGVIHRDVKPSNVMLDKDGQALLADFGLALLTEMGTRGEILGSPTHVAPEQAISSAKAVPQSDLYSVGVILYEMVTNHLPFTADDPLDLAMRHISEPPPPPQQFRPDLPPAVAAVILKALAKELGQRYPTGAALLAALEAALQPSPLPAAAPEPLALVPLPSAPAETAGTEPTIQQPVELVPLPPVPAGAIEPPKAPATLTAPPVERDPGPAAQPLARPSEAPLPPAAAAAAHPAGKSASWVWLTALGAGLLGLLLLAGVCGGLFLLGRGLFGAQTKPTASPSAAVLAGPSGRATTTLLASAVAPPTTAPGASPSPLPSLTPDALLTIAPPTATPTSPPMPTAQVYSLLALTHKEDSLLLVNQSSLPFPLAALRLGDGPAALLGSAWGLADLAPGACVAVVKDTGNPKLPKFDCPLAARLERGSGQRFWTASFNIYYAEQLLMQCQGDDNKPCAFTVTIPTP